MESPTSTARSWAQTAKGTPATVSVSEIPAATAAPPSSGLRPAASSARRSGGGRQSASAASRPTSTREARQAKRPLAAAEALGVVDLLLAEVALLGNVGGLGRVVARAQCPDCAGSDRQRCKADTGDAYRALTHAYLR